MLVKERELSKLFFSWHSEGVGACPRVRGGWTAMVIIVITEIIIVGTSS